MPRQCDGHIQCRAWKSSVDLLCIFGASIGSHEWWSNDVPINSRPLLLLLQRTSQIADTDVTHKLIIVQQHHMIRTQRLARWHEVVKNEKIAAS